MIKPVANKRKKEKRKLN